jgi:hypothetical protein
MAEAYGKANSAAPERFRLKPEQILGFAISLQHGNCGSGWRALKPTRLTISDISSNSRVILCSAIVPISLGVLS